MEFKKFSSIENSYRDKFIDRIRHEKQDGGDWVVMEKVHGAQFSIYYDGSSLRASTRTAFLEDGDDFYNWKEVLEEHRENMQNLYKLVKETMPDASNFPGLAIIVYGELFGGSYPHPDVLRIKTAKRLQKGVFYHPGNLFYVFDLRVNEKYLTVDQANPLFEQAGFFYAKTLFRGTMDQCLKHPNEFPSKISQWLNLPTIEGNNAEGIVIKPIDPRFMGNGDRIIIKSKNEKFKEKKAKKKRPKVEEEPLSETAVKLQEELESLVTENRLQNVLSKKGELPYPLPKDYFGEVMKDLNTDIFEEFNKDHKNQFDSLDKKEQKKLSKAVTQAATKIVRKALFC